MVDECQRPGSHVVSASTIDNLKESSDKFGINKNTGKKWHTLSRSVVTDNATDTQGEIRPI